jgi:hypothetical protein
MNPDEIKVHHCYSMRPLKGRRIIVRVTKLFDMSTRMAAPEDLKRGETDSATMTTTVVRFVWRYAAYPTGWSRRQQQLRLADFALRAEEDVACS